MSSIKGQNCNSAVKMMKRRVGVIKKEIMGSQGHKKVEREQLVTNEIKTMRHMY